MCVALLADRFISDGVWSIVPAQPHARVQALEEHLIAMSTMEKTYTTTFRLGSNVGPAMLYTCPTHVLQFAYRAPDGCLCCPIEDCVAGEFNARIQAKGFLDVPELGIVEPYIVVGEAVQVLWPGLDVEADTWYAEAKKMGTRHATFTCRGNNIIKADATPIRRCVIQTASCPPNAMLTTCYNSLVTHAVRHIDEHWPLTNVVPCAITTWATVPNAATPAHCT